MSHRLLPAVELIQVDRLSTLTYAGAKKLTRLPPRSAIVAFSAAEVYETAELIRRQKGGAAVVMGALSPPTRKPPVPADPAGRGASFVHTAPIRLGRTQASRQ